MNLSSTSVRTALAPLMVFALLLAASCKDNATDTASTTAAADNTKANGRDRAATITPVDQGNNAADLNTTQQIRKALMADDTLSSDAKNAKVVTANGVITLRGPVKSDAERKNVEAKATQAAGSNRVDNILDVVAPKP